MQVDKGFQEMGIFSVDLTLPVAKYRQLETRVAFFDAILQELRSLPGVERVGLTNVLPLSGHAEVNPIIPDGADPEVKDFAVTDVRFVNADYFQAMSIPLRQGQLFQDAERNRNVAIVSARTAGRVWPGESAIGKRFRYASRTGPLTEVIGIAGDVQVSSLQESAANQTLMVYIPYWQRTSPVQSLVLQASVPPEAVASSVRNAVWKIDPDLPVPEFRTMQQVIAATTEGQRFRLAIIVAFASVAIALAAIGVFGVISYSVSQRRNEIGIRIALGARPTSLRRMILRQGLTPVIAGLLLGFAGALAAGRLLSGLLFGVSTFDARIYLAVAIVVLFSSLAACLLPARTATKVDPATVLREG
jgi:putative ABC transport system permease protein